MIRLLYFVLISSFFAACSPVSQPDEPAVLNTYVDDDTKIIIEIDTVQRIDTIIVESNPVVIECDELPAGTRVKYLAIHCTASPPSSSLDGIETIRWWQRTRGWNRWGYHVIFHRDGRITNLNPDFVLDEVMTAKEIVYGVRGINRHTISIAYIGGVSQELSRNRSGRLRRKAEDNMTKEQYYAMRGYIQAVKSAVPNILIGGHRDFRAMQNQAYKACPSFDVQEKFGDVIPDDNRLKF